MFILKLYLIIEIIKICNSEFVQLFHPFNPATQPLVPLCPPPQQQTILPAPKPIPANTTVMEKPKDNLKFLLPFMDMEIQYDRNIFIMQEPQKQQIYILHGHELYQMFISRQEKRLSLLAYLEGSVRYVEPLGAKIINWHGNLLMVIALDEHLEVYQLAEDILLQRAEIVKDPARAQEPVPVFEAIQQLTLTGRFQKLFLFSPAYERIMIVAAVNFTKLYGKFRTFEWFNTYFDPIEEVTVPAIHVVNVVGAQTKYLISGRAIKHQSKTILTIYEITSSNLRLQVKQTLTVQSRVVHIFTYRHRNMIVACTSKQQKCTSFRQMIDGHFSVYRHRTSKEFAFDLLTSSSRFVGATRQNQIMIFTNHRLDCYGSFISDQKDVTDLMGHQNEAKEDYVLVIYKRPFKLLVRIVEMEINVRDLATVNQSEPEDILASTRHQHLFETTVGELRSLLLRRKMDMDILRKVSHIVRPKLKDFEVNEPLTLHAGNVGIIKIENKSLKSPLEILERISQIKDIYIPQRSKRSKNLGPFNITLDVMNRLKVNKMKVKNLIYQGDLIEGFSLKLSNNQTKFLNITNKIKTHHLNVTTDLSLPQDRRAARQHNIPDLFFDLTPTIRVNHLKVQFINGVPWQEFYDLLFLKNRNRLVKGRLVFQSQVDVKHLTTRLLNGLIVSNLFNLKHPQIIHSDLVISRFFVHDLRAKTVNGLDFEEDIVFSGTDTFIETPVIMHHLSISGDLIMADNTKIERLANVPEDIEFKQFYTNKVIINGSLIVNNLIRENNKTKIILGDDEFDEQDLKEKYLLREEDQNFTFPIIFDEAKVTAPWLESNFLNDHKTEQHMLVNKVNSDKPLLVVFMNAHVPGDVVCVDYKSKIAEIKENIIRPGDKVNITGIKQFEEIEVKEVEVVDLNKIPVKDLIFKSLLNEKDTLKFRDSKTFIRINVKNPSYVEQELKASYLNNLPLEDLLNNDYYVDRLEVPFMVNTANMVFHKINGIPFDEFFNKLNVKEERLVLHKDLIVEGNIQFAEPLELQYINNISWTEYVKNLVRNNEDTVIEGDVCFHGDLTITKDFESSDVNGSDLEMIFNNILMKSKPQLITGAYQFDSMNVSNMDVLKINNINVNDFMDLSVNFTEFKGDLIVDKLYIKRNLESYFKEYENLLYLNEKLMELVSKPWKNLYVLKNASWPPAVKDNAQQELMKYLYKSAVKSNQDQIITGNVKLSKPLISKMQTRLRFPSNIDIEFIHKDGLLRNSSIKQIVKGEKHFLKTLYMESVKAYSGVYTNFLNKIDVLRFNHSLYRLTSREPLQGPLKFIKPLFIGHLHINGSINGLKPELIYQLKANSPVSPVYSNELYSDQDIFIKYINDMNMEYLLNNRVTLQGPTLEHFGVLTFENLIIEKDALIQSINGIPLDNLVFKHSPYLQTITGHKILEQSLELKGPAHIMHLNDKDLMELYRNSLKKDNNYQFDHLLIDQATFEKGLEVVRNLNSPYQQRSFAEIEDLTQNNKESFIGFLQEFKTNLSLAAKDIIYLDYDLKSLVKWQDNPGIAIKKSMLYELSRISCCEKKFVQISYMSKNQYYLQNITSNRLTTTNNRISVKAENYCKYQYRKVKSKVTITGPKLLKVFGMKRFIETIYILNISNSTDQLIILHALDLPAQKRNEVRIFKISAQNNSIHDWQGLIQNIGEQLKLFRFSDINVLLSNGLIDHHPALTIYHFDYKTHLFKIQQILDGDYDIMEMVDISNKSSSSKQLILSCSKCQRIFIYEMNPSHSSHFKYEIFQIISLKSSIDKIIIFSLERDHYMLVISQRDSYVYNIYKYSFIQGWKHLSFGYFPNLQMSIPLTELWLKDVNVNVSYSSEGVPLILLCNLDNCYLVKAVI
ncbi:female sterile (1) M3 [Cochliomyia hominivorax]